MTIELAMHQDEEKARPNFFVRMVSSLGGGGGLAAGAAAAGLSDGKETSLISWLSRTSERPIA